MLMNGICVAREQLLLLIGHGFDPCHLILCFQQFVDAFFLCHLLCQQGELGVCPNTKNYIICDSIEECCKDADIITVAVSTPTGGHTNYPFIEREWIKPGCLITSVGAVDFPDELVSDPNTLLVVDNKKLYEAWADEYPYPTFDKMFLLGDKFTDMAHDGKLDWNSVVNIGAIASGKVPGRTSDDQIILYSIGGMPVEDVAWGKTVYENAVAKGIGTKLNLWDKPYLY